MFSLDRCMRIFAVVICSLLTYGRQDSTLAAEKAQIEQAIERGKRYLFTQQKTGASGSLSCYSLIKAGVDKDRADIQKCLQEVLAKCKPSGYGPGSHHTYEAGVDAMFLEAVDRDLFRPQLELIAKFLMSRQRSYGGWYYEVSGNVNSNDFGDTSISQYAILGLWAAARAGVDIPIETWERAAKWLLATQRPDGGFTYHPAENVVPNLNTGPSSGTMTVAGTGSLLVIRHVLHRDTDFDDGVRPAATGRRFGVLERAPDDKEKVKIRVKTNTTMSAAAFDKAIKEGLRWTSNSYADPTAMASYQNYYFYGIERMAALLDVDKLGTHDWYDEGADNLLMRQTPDGSWNDSCGPFPATALTLLFLTKATAGTIHKPKRTPLVGGGLLVGGRGLPENLDSVKIKEGEVTKRKQHGPVDSLLAELEKSSGAKVEAAQEAVVEAVQLEHPEQLIGQVDRLKRLATDKRIEVRRTAMWGLGRTGNVSVAPYLIQCLSDVDESVMREASAALCILSRRPNGCGLSPDPDDGLADDASNDDRAVHIKKWQKKSAELWNDWYMRVRPYDERDDRATLKRKP